ncbi:hypothetical protein L917_11653 [Phytophthora nicotianae]|nr:hypothetical protein L915_11883 [Phytophthora nicotianae]ETL36184.1 hypothetical protein L916_11811 [Phytophthora nicotianae]ETL89420.1 hypothetical protein L917_11653 [Phytophthora nicotianae]ETO71403.1 hypothetical protein F444_12261 [Phytophthora nicotianae P1976]
MIKQAKIKAAEKQRASDLQRFQDWYEKEKFGPEKVKEILYYYENLLIAERKGKMKQLQKWRWHKMSLDYEDYYWKRERGITPAN